MGEFVLTQEQIRAEPAGSQLDDWTAEYVMGWKLCEEENPYGYSGQTDKVWRSDPDGMRVCRANDWLPSKKMTDAFCVMEKIKGACPVTNDFTMEWDSYEWSVGFRIDDYERGWLWELASVAETLPLAICRLALLLQLPK